MLIAILGAAAYVTLIGWVLQGNEAHWRRRRLANGERIRREWLFERGWTVGYPLMDDRPA